MTDEVESGEAYCARTLQAERQAELIEKLWALSDEMHLEADASGWEGGSNYLNQYADELEQLLPPRVDLKPSAKEP